MKLVDHISMCWNLVLRNRRRYKAVIAAIAFGTAGFIIVRTMGSSVEGSLGEHLELLGEATVMRVHWDAYHDNFHPGKYDMRDVNRIRRIPDVMAVAPVVSLPHIKAYVGTTEWAPSITGVDQSYWRTQTPYLLHGRLIGPSDVVGRKRVCVLGQDVIKYLFDEPDPVGRKLRVGEITFTVIGVLGGIQHTEIRRSVFVPITTGQDLFGGLYWIREMYVRAANWDRVETVRQDVLETLKAYHKGYEQGIRVEYYPSRIKTVTTTVYIVKLFIYASIAVTFLLGKVGLTSVMLAAVQDRTREIGLRKALGAREEVIMAQFLTESVFISLLSGFLGVAVGLASVQLLKGPLGVDVSAYAMSSSVALDLAFTITIGVVSGMYPSLKASRLDPVTAMRFE
ncbi:MAG: ABC transporter permease [Desulfomonilaceae bacterium]|nr:ABC transporter permease [Desulfomonilaceae bacterium]